MITGTASVLGNSYHSGSKGYVNGTEAEGKFTFGYDDVNYYFLKHSHYLTHDSYTKNGGNLYTLLSECADALGVDLAETYPGLQVPANQRSWFLVPVETLDPVTVTKTPLLSPHRSQIMMTTVMSWDFLCLIN